MSADPLRCPKCNAPVPLASAHAFPCPYCKARVAVPADYRRLFELHALEADVHARLEAEFRRAMTPPSWRVDVAALALVLVLPAAAAAAAVTATGSLHIAALFTGVIVPALAPGTCLWLWTAAVHATIVRFQLALGAIAASDHLACRVCDAPLATPPADALSERCAYCGSDNLVVDPPQASSSLRTALQTELRTLGDATTALRLRRRLVLGGIAIALVLLSTLAALVSAAAAHY